MTTYSPPPGTRQDGTKGKVATAAGAAGFIITSLIMRWITGVDPEVGTDPLWREAVNVLVSSAIGAGAAGIAAYRFPNKPLGCHPIAVTVAAAFVLSAMAGCTATPEEPGIEPQTTFTVDIDANAAAEFALGQVRTWNALGIDPLQFGPEYQMYVAATCGTLVGASEFVTSRYVTGEDILAWCEAVLAAIAPAVASPMPAPIPASVTVE